MGEEAEVLACRDFYRAAPASLGFRVEPLAGSTLFLAPRVPVSYFNRALGFLDGIPLTETDFDRLIGIFSAAGVSDFWIQLTPNAAPPALPGWLAARGFSLAPRASWAKFVRQTSDPPPWRTHLEVRPALADDAAAIARVIGDAYELPAELRPWIASLVGRPDWLFFVACAEGAAVATAAVHVQKDTAWLGFAATDARYRRLGAHGALLALRIEAAAKHGCQTVVTETGEPKHDEPNPSLANIRSAGFVQVCSRLNYRKG